MRRLRANGREGIVLELRPNCEHANGALPPASADARVLLVRCTVCATCVDTVLGTRPDMRRRIERQDRQGLRNNLKGENISGSTRPEESETVMSTRRRMRSSQRTSKPRRRPRL